MLNIVGYLSNGSCMIGKSNYRLQTYRYVIQALNVDKKYFFIIYNKLELYLWA